DPRDAGGPAGSRRTGTRRVLEGLRDRKPSRDAVHVPPRHDPDRRAGTRQGVPRRRVGRISVRRSLWRAGSARGGRLEDPVLPRSHFAPRGGGSTVGGPPTGPGEPDRRGWRGRSVGPGRCTRAGTTRSVARHRPVRRDLRPGARGGRRARRGLPRGVLPHAALAERRRARHGGRIRSRMARSLATQAGIAPEPARVIRRTSVRHIGGRPATTPFRRPSNNLLIRADFLTTGDVVLVRFRSRAIAFASSAAFALLLASSLTGADGVGTDADHDGVPDNLEDATQRTV